MEFDKTQGALNASADASQRLTEAPPAADAHAPEASGEEMPGFVLYDDYEEIEAMARAAARRRKIGLGIGLGFAAVAAPLITLLLAGKFSPPNLRPTATVQPAIHAPVLPTPLPLSPEQRRIRDARISIDLHNYAWNQVPPIVSEERAAEKAFASVTDANYKDDKTSYDTIQGIVVPHFRHFLVMATAIRPETAQVRVVHHLMLTSARLKLMAFEQIRSGESDKDRLWRVGVLAELRESVRRARLYHTAIVNLAQATHTKLP